MGVKPPKKEIRNLAKVLPVFYPGQIVEYNSETAGEWGDAVILPANPWNTTDTLEYYDLDMQTNVHVNKIRQKWSENKAGICGCCNKRANGREGMSDLEIPLRAAA